MQIDDTFIVTEAVILSESLAGQDLALAIAETVKTLTQRASAVVANQRPQHRVFALSSTPLLITSGDKPILSLTSVIAIVPKTIAGSFPWAAKGLTS